MGGDAAGGEVAAAPGIGALPVRRRLEGATSVGLVHRTSFVPTQARVVPRQPPFMPHLRRVALLLPFMLQVLQPDLMLPHLWTVDWSIDS